MGTTDSRRALDPIALLLRAGVVALTLATAYIHFTLGGLLFLANAAGYATLAAAMILPGQLGGIRWIVRLALLGFTVTTIVAWVLIGPRFPLAYLDKAIEVALVGLLAVEIQRMDGGPLGIVRKARRCVAQLGGALAGRS
jgi:fructose-specific phosphotransferase system IIC component